MVAQSRQICLFPLLLEWLSSEVLTRDKAQAHGWVPRSSRHVEIHLSSWQMHLENHNGGGRKDWRYLPLPILQGHWKWGRHFCPHEQKGDHRCSEDEALHFCQQRDVTLTHSEESRVRQASFSWWRHENREGPDAKKTMRDPWNAWKDGRS